AVLTQWTGAHELGAVGRQPNCELTESIPAARLSTWIILTSSGVMGGLAETASIAVAGIVSSGTGSLSLAFLMFRAARNQSNMVSYVTTSGPPSSTMWPSSSGR